MPDGLSDPDRERVRRAADLLDEAEVEIGIGRGAPEVKRARDLLSGVEGVEPLSNGSDTVAELRDQLPAGRRALERRAEA